MKYAIVGLFVAIVIGGVAYSQSLPSHVTVDFNNASFTGTSSFADLSATGDAGVAGKTTLTGAVTTGSTLQVASDGGFGGNVAVAGTLDLGSNSYDYLEGVGNAVRIGAGAGNLIANAVQLASDGYLSTGSIFHSRLTLDTCNSGNLRREEFDVTGDTGGKQTKRCLCILKNDGTTYAWRNDANTVASGHRYGNTTTCPDTDE